jgi:SsrA-binding protein
MSYITNKKAHFDFEVTEKYTGGIELLGIEVKTIKKNQGSLLGAYVGIRGGEAFLLGADIPPYQMNNTPESYDRHRARRILLTKKEIKELADAESKKGTTIIPISLFPKANKIKIEIGVARGKKKYDKRESIKERDSEREVRRENKF